MIDIIIVGDYNETTKQCMSSIGSTAPYAHVIVTPFTGNYNQSLNNGLRKAKNDYIALCNNDIIFKQGWFREAKKWLIKYDTVCPIEPTVHENVDIPIEGFKKIEQFTGWCIITKRGTIDKIGGKLDTSALFYRSDALFARQLMKAGCKNALIPKCFVLHEGSKTLNTVKDKKKYDNLTIEQIRKIGKVKGFDY